jgi:hypothetical protein
MPLGPNRTPATGPLAPAGQALIINPGGGSTPVVSQCRGFTATAHFKNVFIPGIRDHPRMAVMSCCLHQGASTLIQRKSGCHGAGRVPRAAPAPKAPYQYVTSVYTVASTSPAVPPTWAFHPAGFAPLARLGDSPPHPRTTSGRRA